MNKSSAGVAFSVKIAFSAALLAIAGIGLFAWLSYRQHAGHISAMVREELAATVRNAAPLFTGQLPAAPCDKPRLVEELEALDRRNARAGQFRLFSVENGEVKPLASSLPPTQEGEPEWDSSSKPHADALLACVENLHTCVTPVYSNERGRWVSAFAPVTDDEGRLVGVLAVDRKAVELEELVAAEVKRTFLYSIAALAASVGLGIFLSIRVTRPLRRLYRATGAAREGRFEPVEAEGRDEIAALARDFNETHATLLEKMAELEALAAELEEKVEKRTEQLREIYEDARRTRDALQREISVARRVQETIVPKSFKSEKVAVDVEYLPIMGLGGDWGVVSSRHREGSLDIAVGDVTGHGLGAALVVNRVYTLVSRMCAADTSLDTLVKQLDFFLAEELSDIGIYMTFSACRLDLESKEMSWVGAGHPPLLIYRKGRIERFESTCGLLGVGEMFCEEPMTRDFALESGDILVLHTDGVSDAFNAEGEVFGFQRVEETVLQVASGGCDGAKIASCLTEEVKNFTGGRLQDDVLITVATII